MDFEYAILDFIRNNLTNESMNAVMTVISFLGNAGWIWIVAGMLLSVFPKTRKIGFSVCCALIFSLVICNLTLKPIIARVRPYDLREGIELIISSPTDFSFPSGHTSASFAAAVAIFLHNKRIGIGTITLAVFIAFSRLYLYVHFPTDVLGGMIIGTVCGVLGYFVIKYIDKRFGKNFFGKYS